VIFYLPASMAAKVGSMVDILAGRLQQQMLSFSSRNEGARCLKTDLRALPCWVWRTCHRSK